MNKSISLSFALTSEEASEYIAFSEGHIIGARIKRMLFPFILCCVVAYFVDFYVCVCSFCFFLVNVITSAVLNRKTRRDFEKSPMVKRDQTVDFYEEHIVLTYKPSNGFRGTSVKHFPMKAVLFVFEGEKSISFITKNLGMIIIPKRILTAEDAEKLDNLISNVFSDKYKKITDRR